MNVLQRADRFQFNDDLILNKEIEPVFADLMVLVKKRNWLLASELDSAQRKFNRQRFFINAIQKTRAEFAVHTNSRGDDPISQFAVPQPSCFPAFLIHS